MKARLWTNDLLADLRDRGAHWYLPADYRNLAVTPLTGDLLDARDSVLASLSPLRPRGPEAGTEQDEYRARTPEEIEARTRELLGDPDKDSCGHEFDHVSPGVFSCVFCREGRGA